MLLRSGMAACAILGHAVAPASLMIAATADNAAAPAPRVDPDVRQQVMSGRSRVLVELRVSAGKDPLAIAAAQQRVLGALPPEHAKVARRYASVPLLALDVDAEGLRILEGLGDVVVRVSADHLKKPY
jgi:hypothetical protein